MWNLLLHLAQRSQPLLQVRRIMLARNAYVYLVFICITTFLMTTKLDAMKFKVFTLTVFSPSESRYTFSNYEIFSIGTRIQL